MPLRFVFDRVCQALAGAIPDISIRAIDFNAGQVHTARLREAALLDPKLSNAELIDFFMNKDAEDTASESVRLSCA